MFHNIRILGQTLVITSCLLTGQVAASSQSAPTATTDENTRERLAAVIKSQEIAVLSSQIDGVVSSVEVRPGDSFNVGDVLLTLDCTLQTASVNKASAELEFNRNEYKSFKALEKLNSSTKMELARSGAEFAKAKAELEVATYQAEQCQIKAPFDGVVVQTWVEPFENIQAKTQLLRIVNNNVLSVEFLVPSDQLASLSKGMPFSLNVMETGDEYQLQIDRIIPIVDSVNRTVKVMAELDANDVELWAGMSGWAVIE